MKMAVARFDLGRGLPPKRCPSLPHESVTLLTASMLSAMMDVITSFGR
jgi:hypothetical protein